MKQPNHEIEVEKHKKNVFLVKQKGNVDHKMQQGTRKQTYFCKEFRKHAPHEMDAQMTNRCLMAHCIHSSWTKNHSTKYHAATMAGGKNYILHDMHLLINANKNDKLSSGNGTTKATIVTLLGPTVSSDSAIKGLLENNEKTEKPPEDLSIASLAAMHKKIFLGNAC